MLEVPHQHTEEATAGPTTQAISESAGIRQLATQLPTCQFPHRLPAGRQVGPRHNLFSLSDQALLLSRRPLLSSIVCAVLGNRSDFCRDPACSHSGKTMLSRQAGCWALLQPRPPRRSGTPAISVRTTTRHGMSVAPEARDLDPVCQHPWNDGVSPHAENAGLVSDSKPAPPRMQDPVARSASRVAQGMR